MKALSKRSSFWVAGFALLIILWISGSPTMVYPEYQREWHLSATVSTAIFAVYPFTLMVMLIVFGGISDYIGRRTTLLIGLGTTGLAVLILALAGDVGWVFTGRILEGVGTGLATSPAVAALVEFNTSRNTALPGAVNSIASSTGIVASTVMGGLLVEYAPLPTRLIFFVILAMILIALAFIARLPKADSSTRPQGRWRPKRISIPKALRGFVVSAALAVTVAFAVGAVLLSLGAQIAAELLHTDNALVSGIVLAIPFAVGGTVSIPGERLHPQVAVVIGGVISAGFFSLTVVSAAAASLPVFILACVVGGVGYGFAFIGGLGLLNLHAPIRYRAATVAVVYLVAYLGQVVIALGMGTLATVLTLQSSVNIAAPALIVLCLVASAITHVFGREPVGDEAEELRAHPSERHKPRMLPGAGELIRHHAAATVPVPEPDDPPKPVVE